MLWPWIAAALALLLVASALRPSWWRGGWILALVLEGLGPHVALFALLLSWPWLSTSGSPWALLFLAVATAVLALVPALWGAWIFEEARRGAVAPFATPSTRAGLQWGRLLAVRRPGRGESTTHAYARAEGELLELELFRPRRARDGAPHPVIITVHGGGWTGGTRHDLADWNHHLAARGFAVVAPDYRLAPRWRFPAPVEDVRAVMAWIEREGPGLGLDPTRIVLMGRSAGGQIALTAAYDRPVPGLRGVVALYAPTDLVWGYGHPSAPRVLDSCGVLRDYLGGTPASAPEVYERASPARRADLAPVPTLLITAGTDEFVSPRHADFLRPRLEALGVPHATLRLPWAHHGFDVAHWGPGGQLVAAVLDDVLPAFLR